ncbi:MAG: DNA cytosine methyltransferase [Flavobacteriales bacterium]|nr:DNA cytosine methyltransferase [Flavobacteriales bacterium]
MKKELKCISLYSGCGGLDLGIERAGIAVVFGLDNAPNAAKSHAINFPASVFLTNRIGAIRSQDILEATGLKADRITLLAGGPPCPAFSKSRFYRKDFPRALQDPVAAETVLGYLRILEDIRPPLFLLENVKGLAYGVHREALDHILDTAARLGYKTQWKVLNAADYGVPQIRERCFVLGSRYAVPTFPAPTHNKDGAGGLPAWVTAGEALGDLDTDANASDVGHIAGGKDNRLLALIPPGSNYLYLTAKRGYKTPHFEWRSRYWSFLLKLSPDLPSWTIQARRSNNMGPFHWRNRILRIEEVKRIQSFPDDFYLSGNVEAQWRLVGNAVPPLLAEHVTKALLATLPTNKKRLESAPRLTKTKKNAFVSTA